MLLRLLTLFFLLSATVLSAQCADFTLISVECVEDNGEIITFSVIPPDDWFGETRSYIVNPANNDTLVVDFLDFSENLAYASDFGEGTFDFILELVGLCKETIRVSLPEACGFSVDCCGSVSGFMWFDANNNGLVDAGEEAIDGTVYLEDGNGNVVNQITASGDYEFADLSANTLFQLRFEPFTDDLLVPTLYLVNGGAGGDESHMRADFRTTPFTLLAGELFSSINAGFVSCDLSIDIEANEITCSDECEGELTALGMGGIAPYTYAWSNGATTATIDGLCAGDYFVTVTDANGCARSADADVLEPTAISLDFINEPATCSPECDGNIFTVVTGGTSPYTYLWSDGSSASICPLVCEGDYSLTVVDANGCVAVGTTFLTQAGGIEVGIVRSGGDCDPDGGPFSSEFFALGGSGLYTYEWSIDGNVVSTESDWPDAPPFTEFDVLIADQSGCSAALSGITRERVDITNPLENFYGAGCSTVGDLAEFLGFTPEDEVLIVLPNADTISYGDGTTGLIDGIYSVFAITPDETCVYGSRIGVTLISLPDDLSLILVPGDECSEAACLSLSGSLDLFLLNASLSILATSPSGIEYDLAANNEIQLCGISETGSWTFVVDDGCSPAVELTYLVTEVLPCGSLNGTLYSTTDIDCGPLPNAATIPFTIVRITDGTVDGTYFTITDDAGYYSLAVPPGVYTVTPLVNGQEPVYACAEALVTVPDSDIITTDIYVPGELMCPEMEVDICMWQQRRCFENSLFLYYYNAGNVLAPGAVLTVELDEYYTDISADHPFTQVGQTLIFELGDVAFCEFGYITIDFTISCEAPLGETHCVNASITPDGFCDPVPAWNGSLVNITDAVCDGDSVRFTVQNVGGSPMSVPLSYVVVEDGIMMTSEPVVTEPLEASESIEIAVEAISGMYHLITNQEPNAPTENDPTLLIDACDGTVIAGLANIVALGNGVPWQETICLENSGSWDPNDKTGYPTGHTGNMIKPGTRLDYNIRFQNTGTDTAFTVVIRDTLEKSLDLSTFRIGASSHRYRMTIDTNRALTFTFDNIELPDSTTDLAGSQGMISFSIDHDPSLQPGDLIENQAAIYFDFNEPIITNLSVHMIEVMGLPTSLRPLLARSTDIKVFPNPVTDLLSIRIPDNAAERGDVFVITDLFGRDLGRLPSVRRDEGIQVGNLPNGFYYLTLVNQAGQAKGRTGFVVTR